MKRLVALAIAFAATSAAADIPAVKTTGVACPVISAEAAHARKPVWRTKYANDLFAVAREGIGASSCSTEDGRGRCLLNWPGLMEVKVAGRPTFYDVPTGRNAVLTVTAGRSTCVLA